MATLRFGSTPTSVMCHVGDFGCGPGAWTTVLKTDGNKVIGNDERSVYFNQSSNGHGNTMSILRLR